MLSADMYQEDAYRLAGEVFATTRTTEDEAVTLAKAQVYATLAVSAALQEVAEQIKALGEAVDSR